MNEKQFRYQVWESARPSGLGRALLGLGLSARVRAPATRLPKQVKAVRLTPEQVRPRGQSAPCRVCMGGRVCVPLGGGRLPARRFASASAAL
jgi:hypothetical protein